MGGNAIKKFGESIRLTASEYDDLVLEILSILSEEETVLYSQFAMPRLIQSYHNKESHGDMDILVPSAFWHYNDHESVKKKLNAIDYVRNGDVDSYAIPYKDSLFQIDLIKSSSATINFAERYFSFNDLGNLIGRIFHRMGFKFGQHGLLYVLRDNTRSTHVIEEIVVTRDFYAALRFADYDSTRYDYGFDDLIDIFEYTMSSKYATREIFLLENRNSISRIRDKKRKTYTLFLEWLDSTKTTGMYPASDDGKLKFKQTHYDRALEVFPDFADRVNAALEKYNKLKRITSIVNGETVGLITQLSGPKLGIFMKLFLAVYPVEKLHEMKASDIIQRIEEVFYDWKSGDK
jgi:hypothetical protein